MAPAEADGRTCGVAIRDMLVCNFAGWLNLITFFFNDEVYTYTFPVGGSAETPRDAIRETRRLGCMEQAQHSFLKEVELNLGVPH